MTSVLLTSSSSIKRDTLFAFLKTINGTYSIATMNVDDLGLPPQPTNEGGIKCAKLRVQHAKTKSHNSFDWYVAIENSIDTNKRVDVCNIYIEFGNESVDAVSFGISVDPKYIDFAMIFPADSKFVPGLSVTVGELMHKDDSTIDPKNWMKSLDIDRSVQITNGLTKAFKKLFAIQKYKFVPDYPKKGVDFQDMMPLLYDGKIFHDLIDMIVDHYKGIKVDYVAGLESRGLMLASAVAYAFKCGFVPIRKAGKLPREVIGINYGTEYSQDKVEIQTDAIKPGSNVLIIDDLIATGGSLKAAVDLIKKVGGNVVDLCVLREVKPLKDIATKTLGGMHVTVML